MSAIELSELSDEELITAFRAGRADAFRVLVSRYQSALFGYLQRMLGSRDDSEDVFQETFIRVYKALPRFDASRRFKPWLFTIASNLVKNVYRSRGVRKHLSLDHEVSDEGGVGDLYTVLSAEGESPFEEVSREERGEILRKTVESLSFKGRQALVLFYFEGHSYEEIAVIAEVPLGTIKSRIHNATAQLVKKLESRRDALEPESLR